MVNAVASQGLLAQLFSDLVAKGHHAFIAKFLKSENSLDYPAIPTAIQAWLGDPTTRNGSTDTKAAIGLLPTDSIAGLRVLVILADGTMAFDSNASTPLSANNLFTNLKKPAGTFLTDGKYTINEPHAGRSYFQQAMLSATGVASHVKWSTSVSANQRYIAARVGSLEEPVGVVVISMNDA